MRRSLTLLAGAAAATALLTSGCSAGQIAETAQMKPAVPGSNGALDTPDGGLSVRNAMVAYPGIEGYEAGADAPVYAWIFNDTGRAVTVTVTSPGAKSVTVAGGAEATPTASPSPSDSPSPSPEESPAETSSPSGSPSPSPSPEAPPAPKPATVEIAAGSFAAFSETSEQQLRLIGLSEELKPS